MAKIVPIPVGQGSMQSGMPENYTQVTGIYGGVVTPQFLSSPDNVQHSPVEVEKAEQAYAEEQTLRFFRMT